MILGFDASRANVHDLTGTERHAFEVIKRLITKFPNDSIRLYLREPPLSRWGEFPDNVTIKVLKWAPQIMWSHIRLSWELIWHRPDVLFVPADTVPLIHPRRTLTTIHDVAFERYPELYRQASVQRKLGWAKPFVHAAVRVFTLGRYGASERDYHRWSVRQALRTSPIILTVSEFSKKEISDIYQVDLKRIKVIQSGIDKVGPDQGGPRENENRPFMLYIGRLETKKNISQVITAYLEYRNKYHGHLELVLAGAEGYGWEEAKQQLPGGIESQGIRKLGWIEEDTRIRLMQQARFMVFCSRYEGFGLPPLEAMSAGVPVLASTAGSLPEVLGNAAYFTEMDDTKGIARGMNELDTNMVLRQKFIDQGYKRASLYLWSKTAELIQEALEEIKSLRK